jgi:hypothetical protein
LTTSSILKPSSIFGASSIIKSKCGRAHLWTIFHTIPQNPETQNFGGGEGSVRHPAKISQTQQTIRSRQSSQQRKREEGKGRSKTTAMALTLGCDGAHAWLRWRSRLVAKRRVQVLNGSKNLGSGPQRI